MRVDLTFAENYRLARAEDLGQFATGLEFPSGQQVAPSAVRPVEQSMTWALTGGPEVIGPTVELPPPVCVAVSPNAGSSWLGIFHPMLTSARDTNAVVALPDGETFAVLSHGTAYRVWVDDAGHWEEIAPGGVNEPVISRELAVVAFADHTNVSAYGAKGPAWVSERLAWDDLRPLRLDGATLHLEGFDAPINEIVQFTLDLGSGRSDDVPHPDRRLRRADGPI